MYKLLLNLCQKPRSNIWINKWPSFLDIEVDLLTAAAIYIYLYMYILFLVFYLRGVFPSHIGESRVLTLVAMRFSLFQVRHDRENGHYDRENGHQKCVVWYARNTMASNLQ